jgi:hypothetical protein
MLLSSIVNRPSSKDGHALHGGLAEHVGADGGALAQITQKLGAASDLKAAFARRHQELTSAIAAGRDWLGIDHDTHPDRMAFIRAVAPRNLWLPLATSIARPETRERKLIQPAPAAQGPVGQKAAVSFGDLGAIGKALRAARKARREELVQQAESFQSPLFDL